MNVLKTDRLIYNSCKF